MHLLYCDESNIDERQGDFLLYGGVMIDAAIAPELSADIEAIRRDAGIDRNWRLKFNPKPENLSHREFIAVKQAVIEAAVARDVGLLAYAVLHDIADNPDEARRFGINTVSYHFDCCLHRTDSYGLVLLDRFNDEGNVIDGHLTEKFNIGVTNMPFSREYRLRRVLGLHYSTIAQSHFTSLIDIVIGSLRYAMNVHTRGNAEQVDSAHRLLGLLSPMFIRNRGENRVSELGFILSPKTVKAPRYRAQYQSMKDFFAAAGVELEQQFTDDPVR